jgi:hypothetical protein
MGIPKRVRFTLAIVNTSALEGTVGVNARKHQPRRSRADNNNSRLAGWSSIGIDVCEALVVICAGSHYAGLASVTFAGEETGLGGCALHDLYF